MPLVEKGTFRHDPRSRSGRIYIPAVLARDSAFPLKEGKVEIKIEGDHLIIKNFIPTIPRK